MPTPINPLPNLTQYNFDIGDIEEVVTKQNGVNAVLEQLGPQINTTVASINEDMAEIEAVKDDLNPAQIVHAPGSGLSNTAGTAYSRDTGAGSTQIPLNSDLGSASKRAAIGAGDVYARGGILGAVSQSGGVPTGGVIETGSNSNGEYFKFAGGMLICMSQKTPNWESGATTTYRYPADFISTANVTAGGSVNDSGSAATQNAESIRNIASRATAQEWGVVISGAGTNTGSAGALRLMLFAIGRWY